MTYKGFVARDMGLQLRKLRNSANRLLTPAMTIVETATECVFFCISTDPGERPSNILRIGWTPLEVLLKLLTGNLD